MASTSSSWLARMATESGFTAMVHSCRDTKVLCMQRFVRLFAYGFVFLYLVHFLSSLGVSDERIGLFMTLTLFGDTTISFFLTATTDKLGRRKILAAGALLMTVGGVIFALSENYWVLLLASVFGVISPSGKEIGPFRAVEESILAQLTEKDVRSDIFAWYSLFGMAGTAMGTLVCGWIVQVMQNPETGDRRWAYKVIFITYAGLGLAKLLLVYCLSANIEYEEPQTEAYEAVALASDAGDSDDASDADNERPTAASPVKPPAVIKPSLGRRVAALFPHISRQSRSILMRLLLLFILDSFASGMAGPSWLTYYFTTVHSLQPATLGTLFLVTNVISSLSNLFALPLARRLGPLKTMCYTHLPSALFLAVLALPPATPVGTWTAMLLLALRASTSSMDQAPRQAFLAAAVLPAERTAVLGVVNVAKTLAQSGGLGTAGVLAGEKLWVVNFGGAGLMKAAYDLLMLWMFVGIKDRESAGGETV